MSEKDEMLLTVFIFCVLSSIIIVAIHHYRVWRRARHKRQRRGPEIIRIKP